MRKLVILFLAMMAVGCGNNYRVTYSPSYKDDPVRKYIELQDLRKKDPIAAEMMECGTTLSREEYLDSVLKDWPFPKAGGKWVPSRDGIENSDTVVEGFPYNRVI